MREQRRPGGPALSRRTVLSAGAALAAFGATAACGRSERVTERPPSGEDPQTIVSDAYVFGYPLVLMDATRRVARASTPDNQFRHAAGLPTPRRRGPVRPNMDTLYSIAWLDLSAGPMVVQMPEVEPQRYWVLQLLDAWTNTVHNPGNLRPRVAAGAAPPYTYVVTGPGWTGELPPDLVVLPMPTPMVWLLGRIQVDGPEDVPAVRAIQERMRLVPLADWPAGRDPGPGRTDTGDGDVPPVQQVAAMDPAEFFERLCALMAVNPPAPADGPALARFAQLGIAPGGALTGIADDDLAEAVQAVRHTIEVYVDPGIRIDNGWLVDPNIGVYGDDYLRRASTAAKGPRRQPAGECRLSHPVRRGRRRRHSDPIPAHLRAGPGAAGGRLLVGDRLRRRRVPGAQRRGDLLGGPSDSGAARAGRLAGAGDPARGPRSRRARGQLAADPRPRHLLADPAPVRAENRSAGR